MYQKLVYHVVMAEDWELLERILSSLKWVNEAVSHADECAVRSSYHKLSVSVSRNRSAQCIPGLLPPHSPFSLSHSPFAFLYCTCNMLISPDDGQAIW